MHTPIKESRVDRRLCRVMVRIIFDKKQTNNMKRKEHVLHFTVDEKFPKINLFFLKQIYEFITQRLQKHV